MSLGQDPANIIIIIFEESESSALLQVQLGHDDFMERDEKRVMIRKGSQ